MTTFHKDKNDGRSIDGCYDDYGEMWEPGWEKEYIYCLFGRGMEKKKKGKGGGDTLSPTSNKSKYREKEEGDEKEVI